MTVYKCDRCGRIMEDNKFQIDDNFTSCFGKLKRMDLCQDCADEFSDWLHLSKSFITIDEEEYNILLARGDKE